MNSVKVRYMTITGIFTALILVFAAYVHIPGYTGYVHIADGFLFLAASMLPTPYAMFAGAFGAACADLLTGYAIWAPGSLIIKAITVLFFTSKAPKILCKRNLFGLIPAAALCVGGYYLYEVILYGSFSAPLFGMIGNVTQAVFSSAVFVLVGLSFDKAKLREHLFMSHRISK